jgi:hypothetical protein
VGIRETRGTVKALRDAYIAAIREYAAVVTRETIDVLTSPDGTLAPQSATWLRAQLETNFERAAVAAMATVGTDRVFQGLPVDGREAVLESFFEGASERAVADESDGAA